MSTIAENIAAIRARAGKAKLVAVTKMQGADALHAALECGQRAFGENRVQEAYAKFSALRHDYPDLELHMIGALQTNKALEAVELFDVIETLDRPRLAEALAEAIRKTGRKPRLYIEVNIGNEPQKTGVEPEEVGAFLEFCREICGLSIDGLMCIPPKEGDAVIFFSRMRELAGRYALPHLSMGMSADYEKAAASGATEVRVGTAIFGTRITPPNKA